MIIKSNLSRLMAFLETKSDLQACLVQSSSGLLSQCDSKPRGGAGKLLEVGSVCSWRLHKREPLGHLGGSVG